MVKSFKNFTRLDEAILVRDEREEGKPFTAGLNFSSYGGNVPNKYLSFEQPTSRKNRYSDSDRHVSSPEPAPIGPFNSRYSSNNFPSHNLYFSHNQKVVVDPQAKTVSLDVSSEAQNLNRRYNQRLSEPGKTVTRSTPILDSNDNELSHPHLRQLLKATAKHVPDLHDYDVVGDERFHGKKVRDVIREPTANETWIRGREPLTLYHGTSTKKAEAILKSGLVSGQRDVKYGDFVKGYSDHNVYLTTNPHEAANYATREALHDGSRKSTILKVQVHPKDFDKLRPDEDTKHWFGSSTSVVAQEKMRRISPEAYKQASENGFHYKWHNFADHTSIPWTDEWVEQNKPPHETHEEFKGRVNRSIRAAFEHLDKVGHTVAYRGEIKPEHISHHKSWKLTSVKGKDPEPEQYHAAQDAMRKTIKRD